jgi:hypothetical protein
VYNLRVSHARSVCYCQLRNNVSLRLSQPGRIEFWRFSNVSTKVAAGPRQHRHSWFLNAAGLTTIFFCLMTLDVVKLTVCLWEVGQSGTFLLALASTIIRSSVVVGRMTTFFSLTTLGAVQLILCLWEGFWQILYSSRIRRWSGDWMNSGAGC